MHEAERLARLDELTSFEIWCQSHEPAQYMQYLTTRSQQLNALRDPAGIGKGRAKKLHATRGSLLELLNTMKEIGYGNEGLAMFHIDIIVYRMEAIWKGIKKQK